MSEQQTFIISTNGHRIGLDCSTRTMVIIDASEFRNCVLSPTETKALQLFFQLFPEFVPDRYFEDALMIQSNTFHEKKKKQVSCVLSQVRRRISPLGLHIQRIGETGYFLEIGL